MTSKKWLSIPRNASSFIRFWENPRSFAQGPLGRVIRGNTSLRITTANITGWGNRMCLLDSGSDIICFQETKLSRDRHEDAVASLSKAGWQAFGTPAVRTDKGRYSGGCMLLVKAHLQAWAPNSGELVPGRLCRCFLSVRALGHIQLFAGYFYCAEGWSLRNIELAKHVGDRALEAGLPFILGADFQMSPGQLSEHWPVSHLRAHFRADVMRPSYVSGPHCSYIDYFLVSTSLDRLIDKIEVSLDTPIPQHRPATMLFSREVKDKLVLVPVPYMKVPTDHGIGPRPEPSAAYFDMEADLLTFCQETQGALDEPQCTVVGERLTSGIELLDRVYGQWNALAWEELLSVTNPCEHRPGLSGGAPLEWTYKPLSQVLTTRKQGSRSYSPHKALALARDRVREVASYFRRPGYVLEPYVRNLLHQLVRLRKGVGPFSSFWPEGCTVWHPILSLLGTNFMMYGSGALSAATGVLDMIELCFAYVLPSVQAQSSEKWATWCEESMSGGAKSAHAFISDKAVQNQDVVHSEALDPESALAASSLEARLEAQRTVWAKAWQATTTPQRVYEPFVDARLPIADWVTVEEVRACTRHYKSGTCTPDGGTPNIMASGLIRPWQSWRCCSTL